MVFVTRCAFSINWIYGVGVMWNFRIIYTVVFMVFCLSVWQTESGKTGTTDGCAVKICGGSPRTIVCRNSIILIENVTSSSPEVFRVTTAQNIKRMCMGNRKCEPERQCNPDNGERLKIKYVCLRDDETHNTCDPWQPGVLKERIGFIQSENYPAAAKRYSNCRWRINNEPAQYTIIRIHDIQTSYQSKRCITGLTIRADSCDKTVGIEIRICNGQNNSTYKVCGTIRLAFTPTGDNGARFWLSYEVKNKTDNPFIASSLENLIQPCGSNVIIEKTDIFGVSKARDITTPIYDIETATTNSSTIGAISDESEDKQEQESDSDTKLIVIVVLVAIIIIIIINVTAIIIVLRRRSRKHNEASGASHSTGVYPYSVTPLPIHHDRPSPERPSLREGYSKVADEIPYTEGSGSYAEVNDQPDLIPKLPSRPPDVNRRRVKKKPIHSNTMGRLSVQSQGSERTTSPTGSVSENIYEEIEETDGDGKNHFRNCTLPLTHNKTQPAMRPKSVATLRSRFEQEINKGSNNNDIDKKGAYLKPRDISSCKTDQPDEKETLLKNGQRYDDQQHQYFELDKSV